MVSKNMFEDGKYSQDEIIRALENYETLLTSLIAEKDDTDEKSGGHHPSEPQEHQRPTSIMRC